MGKGLKLTFTPEEAILRVTDTERGVSGQLDGGDGSEGTGVGVDVARSFVVVVVENVIV